MGQAIEFFLVGRVHPKQSYRHNPVKYADGRVTYGHASTKQKKNQTGLAQQAAFYAPREPFSGAVRVDLVFLYPWRKAETLTWRERGRRPKTTKPDCEQIEKQVVDALGVAGFFVNDAQVFKLSATKWWQVGHEGVDVLVEEVDEEAAVTQEAGNPC